jgi:UDP-glucose 4-epimerase
MVGENYLHFYYYQYRLNYTILRYANVYGPRQISTGEAGVVSIFIKKLLNGERPIINTYPDNLNGMIRDYVYVKDVVKANLMVLNNGENEIFNIGTCIETNTLTIFNEIKNQLNIDI